MRTSLLASTALLALLLALPAAQADPIQGVCFQDFYRPGTDECFGVRSDCGPGGDKIGPGWWYWERSTGNTGHGCYAYVDV